MKMNKIRNILFIALIIIFTISIVPKEFQNDTFFTIAIGENILKNGIENEEKLVWHEGLEFTNSRWLFDVLITEIYNAFDFIGVYVFVIIMAVLQMLLYYIILNKITKRKLLAFIFTIIITHSIKYEFAARAQIISFTLFLLEFYCIESLAHNKKIRYIITLIVIPIILANLHSSVFPVYFVFYLPYIAEFIISKLNNIFSEESKIITEKTNIKIIFVLFLLGFLLGLCTPTGFAAYTDMFKAMGGISAEFISELKSITIFDEKLFSVLIIVTFGIIAFTKVKVKLTDCLYILGFCIMGLYTYRCVFFFYLISSICIFRIFNNFLDEYIGYMKFNNNTIKYIITFVLCLLILTTSIKNFTLKLSREYIRTAAYPVDASKYILKNLDVSKIKLYNHFNFGSYLEFVGIPVFIDSRSGIYTPEFNEGCYVLSDWYALYTGKITYKELFDEYEITHALLYNDETSTKYIVYDDEWKLIYNDDAFSLFERTNIEND